jgi:phytoene dehydrogenase-like protein
MPRILTRTDSTAGSDVVPATESLAPLVFAVQKKTAIVIGSGIAGLACAAQMAVRGWRVQVFEKAMVPGWQLGVLEREGFLLTPAIAFHAAPPARRTFCSMREKACRLFSYRRLDEGTRYFWSDGTRLHAHPARLSEELTKAGIPHNASALVRYLRNAADLYEHIGRIFLDEPIHELKTWLSPRIPAALVRTKLAYLTQNLHAWNTRKLRHPKLVQLFDRFATYNGSDPIAARPCFQPCTPGIR